MTFEPMSYRELSDDSRIISSISRLCRDLIDEGIHGLVFIVPENISEVASSCCPKELVVFVPQGRSQSLRLKYESNNRYSPNVVTVTDELYCEFFAFDSIIF